MEKLGEGIVKLTVGGDNRPMESPYRRHRFPPEIISYAVWLYHRFTLSLRSQAHTAPIVGNPGRVPPSSINASANQ